MFGWLKKKRSPHKSVETWSKYVQHRMCSSCGADGEAICTRFTVIYPEVCGECGSTFFVRVVGRWVSVDGERTRFVPKPEQGQQ